MLAWRESPAPGVGFAFTDRRGGVSSGGHAELNLGGHVGDDAAAVAENRRRVAAAVGVAADRLVLARQVHGADVAVVDGPWAGEPPAVDALVTRTPGLALAVLVADCTPVLLADPAAGVVAVAHAGRVGLQAGVVPAVLAAMRDMGATAVLARIGPAACGRCYEVPSAMREEVAAALPATRSTTRAGTPALDVPAGVAAQLGAAGVPVRRLPRCTIEDADLYSYRRERTTGRSAGLAWLAA